MFQRRDTPPLPEVLRTSGKIETVLGPGISVKGLISGKGGVRIEGVFEGKIDIEGPLVVGEAGKVVSEEIRAPSLVAGGTLQATIFADKVQVLRSGRIYGDVTTANLSTEEGGFLKGTIHMPEEKPAAPAAASSDDTIRPDQASTRPNPFRK
ncbi:MAG: polymer-forming cytoskeletal protein [Anaerolineales bacterium]|nr:polymer-forming cytoskeletal protein [Anaerolineales bacterium]